MPASLSGQSFEALALPLLPALYRHALWLCRDPFEAEELIQETSFKSLRAFESFQQGTNFPAWVFRILRNTFLTSRTAIAAGRTVSLEEHVEEFDIPAISLTPEEHLLRLGDQASIQEALDRLTPPLREVLLLCDVEEMKYKDIAEVLNVPLGTVMSRISRARRALFELLHTEFEGKL